MTFTIAWVDGQPPEEIAFGQSLLPGGFELIGDRDGAGSVAHERWVDLVSESDALIARAATVGARELRAAPGVQLVQKYGGREDGIDLEAAADAGVAVATMPLRGCIAVAECAMTLALALSKQLIKGHRATVEGAYRELGLVPERTSQQNHAFQWMKLTGLFELSGRSLGIVGFGEIGTEIASRAQAFGMCVSYTKRQRLETRLEDRLAVTWRPLPDLLANSDVVILAAPHTPDTENLIGSEQLQLMRSGAVLINVSRGGLVDEVALVEALRNHRIAGAALDVYVEEPLPFNHPLVTLENVILTPHIGGGTGGAREKQLRDVLDNIVLAATGATPRHLIQGASSYAEN